MYSQNGEDDIVAGLFPPEFKGSLLEIGAYLPKQLSNSRLLIERGWKAVLVEFSPAAVRELVKEYGNSPQVTVVCAAVTLLADSAVPYYVTDDALSTSDPAHMRLWREKGGYYGELWVPSYPLEDLLHDFCRGPLDFCSVDTEGSSAILGIGIMQRVQPRVMCIEHNGRQAEIMGVAERLGYRKVAENGENVILAKG